VASAAPRGVFPQPVNTPRAVQLTWARPSGAGVTATRIEGRDLASRSKRYRTVATVRTNTVKIKGLKAGHRYRYRIRFRTTGTAFGAPGPTVIVRALGRIPSVATGVGATPDGSGVTVQWPAAKGATRYRVERVDVLSGDVERISRPSTRRSVADTPPARLAGHWLRYRVVAMDGGAEAKPSVPVEVRAPGFAGYTAYYALGDSYSAGTGVGQPYDDQPCARSGRMWANLIPRDLVPVPQFIACSGATTENVRLSGDGGIAQIPDIGGTQLDRVRVGLRTTPGPALITFTIGGNDADFVPQFRRCVTGDCTKDADTETALIRGQVRRNLDATFAQVRQVAPGADVLVAGYPKLFTEAAVPIDAVFATTLTQAERKLANVWATQVDEEVAASARAAGLHPVTTEVLKAFEDHGAGSASPWINTVQAVDPGTPIGLAPTLPATSSVHPNVLGNQAYADVMTAALRAYAAKVQIR
jgi:lysophospholipase L1-like esterase